jgi:hypothetical protein
MPTPLDEPPLPVSADSIRAQVEKLVEGLETLGLRSLAPDTWLLTPMVRAFAKAALHSQMTANLSTSHRSWGATAGCTEAHWRGRLPISVDHRSVPAG